LQIAAISSFEGGFTSGNTKFARRTEQTIIVLQCLRQSWVIVMPNSSGSKESVLQIGEAVNRVVTQSEYAALLDNGGYRLEGNAGKPKVIIASYSVDGRTIL
jgi:hypothetical protein